MKSTMYFLIILSILFLQGCSSKYSYLNKEISESIKREKPKAILTGLEDKGMHQPDVLFILSLSGGGMRAAYWSASIMFGLEKVFEDENINLLKEVDVISSVSGGSISAAYYAITKDPGDPLQSVKSNRVWQYDQVMELFTRNYKLRWLGNWFWPDNILKYWFTDYDRSDIMAETLTDNLFDVETMGIEWDLKFKDINPDRPYLVLNATNATKHSFGELFTFTQDDFDTINYDINEYYIGPAVMATASFPAVFNYMTLKDYSQKNGYIHLFDGGNYDNLGLSSAMKIIENNKKRYKKIVVVMIDAYTESKGVKSTDSDARKFFDYAVDLNFLDSFDSLLAKNRNSMIQEFKNTLFANTEKETFFYHIQFKGIQNQGELNSIKTDFKLSKSNQKQIDKAVNNLMRKDNECLSKLKDLLVTGDREFHGENCHWRIPDEIHKKRKF